MDTKYCLSRNGRRGHYQKLASRKNSNNTGSYQDFISPEKIIHHRFWWHAMIEIQTCPTVGNIWFHTTQDIKNRPQWATFSVENDGHVGEREWQLLSLPMILPVDTQMKDIHTYMIMPEKLPGKLIKAENVWQYQRIGVAILVYRLANVCTSCAVCYSTYETCLFCRFLNDTS